MIRLYLIRHGETAWNAEGRYISHTDLELSDSGIEQAQSVAKRLDSVTLDTIFVSPRSRARQTADYLAESYLYKPVVLKELEELNFGGWEGLTFTDIEARYPGLLETWINDPSKTQIPKGESWRGFAARVSRGFGRMVAGRDEEAIAVVTHGGTIRALLIATLGLDPAVFGRITVSHGAVTALDVHGEWVFLRYLNDGCHQGAE